MDEHTTDAARQWPIRVLVVENEVGMRERYGESLNEWGYEPVLACGKGDALMEHARKLAREDVCHVAQVDMRLGDDRAADDIRGLELIPQLLPAVSIVLTGYGNIDTSRKAFVESGAFDFVGKQDAPEMRTRIAAAGRVACMCPQSRTLHWHPCTARTLEGGTWPQPPTFGADFAQFYESTDGTQALRVCNDALRLFGPWVSQTRPLTTPLAAAYLPGGLSMPKHPSQPVPLPFATDDSLPDPIWWLYEHAERSTALNARSCLSHRALHMTRIMIDEQGNGWLGNITHAGYHHSLYDIMTLAVDVLLATGLPTHIDLQTWYELGVALTAPRLPSDAIRPSRALLQYPATQKALVVLAGLRTIAQQQGRYHDERIYFWGMLLEIVRRLQQLRPDAPQYQHVRLLAALLCVRLELEDEQPWPPRAYPSVALIEAATHKQDIVRQLFESIRMAESRVVIGLPRMSRTRLLDLVKRADVQQHYLREHAAHTLLIPVNCDRLAGPPEQMLYELLLTALIEVSVRHPACHDLAGTLGALRRETITSDNRLLAQRNLEHAVASLCLDRNLNLCFMLDRFDELYRTLPTQLLNNLCALHDQHPGQCCYVLSMADNLHRLRNPVESDAFDALFAQPDLEYPPDGLTEARQLVEQLAARAEWMPPPDTVDHIIALSGCHPGLISTLFLAALHDGLPEDSNWDAWANKLPGVQNECLFLWRGLGRSERQALRALALCEDTTPFVAMLQQLTRRGLVLSNETGPEIFCSLFTAFVQQQHDLLRMDSARRFWRGATGIQINRHQHKLLEYLYEHPQHVCTRSELLDAVFGPKEAMQRDPQNDINLLVRRVRECIEPTPSTPCYLVTRQPDGYQLVGTERDPLFDSA